MQDSKGVSCQLEHVNLTVSDIERSTKMLCQIFGWKLRWQGASIHAGQTAHVGSDDSYIALYCHPFVELDPASRYTQPGSLNHVAVRVDDLEAVHARVIDAGYTPVNHADYEPGRRFYFLDHDGIEFEVLSYRALSMPTPPAGR